jgi:hypothetical protein
VTFAAAVSYVAVVRRFIALGSVAVGLAVLAGCGEHQLGSLVIGIQYSGRAWHTPGVLFPGRVLIFDGHGQRVGVLHVKAGRTATAELPPGHYTLGVGDGRLAVEQRGRCGRKIATVTGSHTTDYTLWRCWPSTPEGVSASIVAAALAQKSVHWSEVIGLDLVGSFVTTADVTADSGTEQTTAYSGDKAEIRLIHGVVYVRGNASALVSELGLPLARARPYARRWIAIPKGDKLYARESQGLTLASAVRDVAGETEPSYGPRLAAVRPLSTLEVIWKKPPHARLVLQTKDSYAMGQSWSLTARASGEPLPITYSAFIGFGNGEGESFSRWNKPVVVTAPANSIPIATVRAR